MRAIIKTFYLKHGPTIAIPCSVVLRGGVPVNG